MTKAKPIEKLQIEKHIKVNPKQKGKMLTEHHCLFLATAVWETTENGKLKDIYSKRKY